jgi:geranylgeranyl diphosphate synthase, type II
VPSSAAHTLATTSAEIALPPALDAALQSIVRDIERDMERRLDTAPLPDNLRAAVKYSALGPGKRLRPALVVLACEALGGDRTKALAPAGAMELIHCFSLVHDDLPAMDDDELRRGRPTLHIHAGEAMAILAGDVMMSLAFEWLVTAPVDDRVRAALVRELAAATSAMIAGQVYDTLGGFPARMNDRQRLDLIHRSKTAALITASCRMGALCANGSSSQLDAFTRYGQSIGLMFQIVDDLLDVTASAEHVGKAVGKDVAAGKLTFPGLLGVEASREEIQRLRQAAHDAFALMARGGTGENSRLLLGLADAMAVRTK